MPAFTRALIMIVSVAGFATSALAAGNHASATEVCVTAVGGVSLFGTQT